MLFFYDICEMNQIEDIKKILATPKDIIIVGHRNPDGDAMGSSLGLKLFLERLGHYVTVMMPSEYPLTFGYLPKIEQTMTWDVEEEECQAKIEKADIIFCLDFNTLSRIDKLGECIGAHYCTKIMIDHHLYPEPFADYMFSDTTASSTCEMVYKFIEDLDMTNKINADIGTCLYTGLVTDTGSFKYNTRAETYEVAADLKRKGIDDYSIQSSIFNSNEEKHLRILGHCLANRMEIFPEYNAAMIYLTKEDYQKFDIQRGDTEGVVNYMLSIKSVKIAAFITEQPTIIKISLRSKGDISVQEIASKHFNGGGHKNASGGGVYATLEAVMNRYKKILPQYMGKK